MDAQNMNIHQRIAAVMAEVSYIQREEKKGMTYRVVSHDKVTALLRPSMMKNGIVNYPVRCEHSHNGNRAECSMTLRFVNIEQPSDFIDVQTFGYGVDTQDKGPGKAMSYAVKYGLLKTFFLETGDDPDNESLPHTREDPHVPPFDPRAAADRLIAKFNKQKSPADLTAVWNEEKDARLDVKAADATIYTEIENAAKARAAEITPKEHAA